MIFSSSIFLVYFLPIVLLAYFLSPRVLKNGILLFASILFYSWGAPKFVFAILATTSLDFYLVKLMDSFFDERRRKLLLILSLCLNLSLLFYFKYCNFFIDNINSFLSLFNVKEVKWINVVLPIGISFYTFESITYVVDVFRREHKPLNNFFQYQLYILLFPKLIAGPIIRFSEIADQITGRFEAYSVDKILNGILRFTIGLAKKVLIANVLAEVADNSFSIDPKSLNTGTAWIGALAYTFQIYFDFSGYSDMAIGLGMMFGFTFPENFNNPYTSASVTEFWRRWHITLGNWMRNYLYIPLGGNRVSSHMRLYFNLWLVFILSGFWHGAAWTFIAWGAYYGIWLVAERMFLLKYLRKIKLPAIAFTFFVVVLGWVLFRADSITHAVAYYKTMFHFENGIVLLNTKQQFAFFTATIFSFFILLPGGCRIQNYIFFRENKTVFSFYCCGLLVIILFTLSLAQITGTDFNPFIYFRF